MQATHPVAATRTAPASKFRLIAELGRGGMATVFLAVVSGMGGFNKLQVVKRLRPGLAADPEFLNMFLEEARLAARINHPNVVQTYEIGFDGEHHFIAMEYLEGQTLESMLRLLAKRAEDAGAAPRDVPEFPMALRLRIVADVLAGLHFAHDLTDFDGTPLNVVHRDVSPHNVIVTYDGHVKLVDFGIAKAADSSADTRTGILKGKCAYMAPEQFGGQNVDRRADVFVCGIILWQLLTGKKLWRGLSDAEIFQRLATGHVPTPRSVDASVPAQLDEICMRALALKPEDRYQTAADFQAALEDYLPVVGRVTSRDVGTWVSKHFAERRSKIKAVIEEQMRATKDAPVAVLRSPATGAAENATSTASVEVTAEPSLPTPGRGRALRIVSLAGLGLISAATLVFAATRPKPVDAPVQAKPATPFGIETPLVTLTISAEPASAMLFVDDVALPSNPSTKTMVRDGASHRVRAEAPGYVTKRELVTFDTDKANVALTLEKAPDEPSKPNTRAQPATQVRAPAGAGKQRQPTAATSAVAPSTPPPAVEPVAKPAEPSEAPKPSKTPKPEIINTKEDPWK